jgi:Protein of unknown function (DUF2752)
MDVSRAARPRLRGRVLAVGALAAATATVAFVDPDGGGPYPPCPSRTLFGIDCPGCGGLRGTHALLHGRLGEALDHNLLLLPTLAVLGVVLAFWLLPLVGRPARPLNPPRWAVAAGVAVAVAFTVARNLPFGAFEFLASDA